MRIKLINIVFRILLFIVFSINAGCEQPETALIEIPAETDNNIDSLPSYIRYAPSKIDIMPLTEFISTGDTQRSKINLYVSLLDTFGSQIKSPGIFRFELYEQIPRSAEPKGKRVIIWPDIDLNDPVTNNNYWRDFLRAYMFNLPYEQAFSQDYILQVTCICPNGKRLSSDFTLKHTK
jgi:hypothetical protein